MRRRKQFSGILRLLLIGPTTGIGRSSGFRAARLKDNAHNGSRRLTRIEHFVHQNSPDKEGHMAVLATDGPAFEWQVPRAAPTG
jgi:hypothetical protein